LGVGAKTRTLPGRLRRAIHLRDRICTADGCLSTHRLQPHHIVHRADGGDDDPSNLTLLCWFHHHVVIHRRGHRIDPTSAPGRIRFLPPEPGTDPPI
jgi:HNH endonuclease